MEGPKGGASAATGPPPPRGPHPLRIQLCWLALLLVRVVENATGDTWRNVRHALDRMHLVTSETKEGRIATRSVTTKGQQKILAALKVREPAQILDCELPTPAA